jgi:hypothetical protein
MAFGNVPVSPNPAASVRDPAINTGVFNGNFVASAPGADPTTPITDDLTVLIGRKPASISKTSTPCKN